VKNAEILYRNMKGDVGIMTSSMKSIYRKAVDRTIKVLVFLLIVSSLLSCASREARPAPKPAKIALVLGAGAARGFAHIGVLKVLESNKIPIHMIVGTSAGSFVGSIYAYGFNTFELQKLSFGIERDDIIDFTIPDNGFIKGEKLESYVNRIVRNTPIEKLRIPFYAVTTDLQSGREVVFGIGNTGSAVRASCSIPGIFVPPVISGRMYVDGGVVSPVGVEAARKLGADVVIAVDLSEGAGASPPTVSCTQNLLPFSLQKLMLLYGQRSHISGAQISHRGMKRCSKEKRRHSKPSHRYKR
jgi:NTE family protein